MLPRALPDTVYTALFHACPRIGLCTPQRVFHPTFGVQPRGPIADKAALLWFDQPHPDSQNLPHNPGLS